MTQKRLESLRQLQARHGVACVALMPGANLTYFTGLTTHLSERPALALVPAKGPLTLVLPVLEAPAAREVLPKDVRLFTYSDEEGHEGAFMQAAEALGLQGRPLGVEYLAMRVLEARRLEQVFPGSPLMATEPWLPALRMAKEEGEIARMRRAVQIAEAALTRLMEEGTIQPGRTELEIAAELRIALLREGSQGEAFAPIVVAGPNSAFPHAGPSDRPLESGDLLTIDWGALYQGYQSDITRTFVMGEPTLQMERMHDAVLAANQAGRLVARAGIPAQEVDRAARRAITLAGWGEYFIHRTGHGLGLDTHEPPYLVEGNLELLPANTTFTVEPGVYVPGLGGIRIEDDVVALDGKSETLTALDRALVRL